MRSWLFTAQIRCISRRSSLSRSGSCFFHFSLPSGCQSPSGKVTKGKIGKLLLLFCPGNRVSLPGKKSFFTQRNKKLLNLGSCHFCKPKCTRKKLSREKKIGNTTYVANIANTKAVSPLFLSFALPPYPHSPCQRIRVLLPNREQYSPSFPFPSLFLPPILPKTALLSGNNIREVAWYAFSILKKNLKLVLAKILVLLKYSTLKISSEHPVLQYTMLLQRHSGIRMPCLHALLPFLLLLPFVEAKSGKLPPTTQHRLLHAPKKIESYAEMYIHPASALLPLHGINMCLYLIPKSGKTSKKCQT